MAQDNKKSATPQSTLTKKVTLKLWGQEIEWDFYDEDGDNDESVGCLLCEDPGDITIYVDDVELEGGNVKEEHSNHTNTHQLDQYVVKDFCAPDFSNIHYFISDFIIYDMVVETINEIIWCKRKFRRFNIAFCRRPQPIS